MVAAVLAPAIIAGRLVPASAMEDVRHDPKNSVAVKGDLILCKTQTWRRG